MAEDVIKESREMRLQSFNEYRKRFGLKPYTSFQEFTGMSAVSWAQSLPLRHAQKVKEITRRETGMMQVASAVAEHCQGRQ